MSTTEENMFEQLFGSRVRVKLLRIFLNSKGERFYVRELVRKTGEQINSVRRELARFEKMGLVEFKTEKMKKFFFVNEVFPLYNELRALFLRARLTIERSLLEELKRGKKIQHLSLLGYFTDDTSSPIDIFMIGTTSKKRVAEVLGKFSKRFGQDLRYTVITPEEYKYRHDITDRFLFDILGRKKVVLFEIKK